MMDGRRRVGRGRSCRQPSTAFGWPLYLRDSRTESPYFGTERVDPTLVRASEETVALNEISSLRAEPAADHCVHQAARHRLV